MLVALRATVMVAIVIACFVARGFAFGSWQETFAIALCASGAAQAVVAIVARSAGRAGERPAWRAGDPGVMIAAIVIAGGAAAFLLAQPAPTAARRARGAARSVATILANAADDDAVTVHGYLQIGSMLRRVVGDVQTLRFTVVDKPPGPPLTVEYTGYPPDTLQDRAEIIATGHLVRDANGALTLTATDLIAKCPSTYQTAQGPVPASRFR